MASGFLLEVQGNNTANDCKAIITFIPDFLLKELVHPF
jgi:hypothetical protein